MDRSRLGPNRIVTAIIRRLRLFFFNIQLFFSETFGLGRWPTLAATVLTIAVVVFAVYWFFHSAPPTSLVITSGDKGSRFYKVAEKYAKILERNGVKVKILTSEGSLENLERLADPAYRVDVGFVQTGVAKGFDTDRLVSLGSISYEPLYVFYRSQKPLELLSQFSGKKLAIGEDGTGTQILALELLGRNNIKPGGDTRLLEMDDDEAHQALLDGKIDAVFLMGDSASTEIIRDFLRDPGIRLFDFTQAEAYTRRIGYLSRLVLLKGAIDFGRNIPNRDVNLLSPTVELIAREDLHPVLSDLLLEAATEIHGRQSMFQRRGEFPVLLDHEYRLSSDAQRFYKSGKKFFYRYLPFRLASMLNRIVVAVIPLGFNPHSRPAVPFLQFTDGGSGCIFCAGTGPC